MEYAIVAVLVLLGLCIVAYLYLDFEDKNSVEKKAERKWTDPNGSSR